MPRLIYPLSLVLACALMGSGIAVLSSPRSLTSSRGGTAVGHSAPPTLATPSPSPTLSSTPTPPTGRPAAAGILGQAPEFLATKGGLIAAAGSKVWTSADGGKQWQELPLAGGSDSLMVDPGNPRHLVAGGPAVQVSNDGGSSWSSPQKPPAGPGPWRPLLISPADSGVWFLLHQGHLSRTRDAGVSWRDLPGLPALGGGSQLVWGAAAGQFLLASDAAAFELTDNGQQLKQLPALAAGARFRTLAVASGTPVMARATDGKVYLLRNGWVAAAANGLGGPIAAAPNGRMWVGDGNAALGHAGAVSYSTDGGQTWQLGTGLPADQPVDALAADQVEGGKVYAYCFGGDIYVSLDSGRSWKLMTSAFRTRSS